MNLLEATDNKLYKIIQINGGKSLVMKLSLQNIYLGDVIKKLKTAILGPIKIQKITDNSKIALGKDIAIMIIVEKINESI